MSSEQQRLNQIHEANVSWRFFGPYLSERQWGTVREDYSKEGNAWEYFSHDQARSRAYRWGEDGLAGVSDLKQRLCFALALWNGKDSILKERLFGLTNSEGNHGEDVKEYYYYLDSTPTHSYMKYLYKYPQQAYPYEDLVAVNRQRTRCDNEYELIDTGVFNENRYFDVFVEYAKEAPEELLIRISVHNHGPETAALHLLPTLWFRNTWSWSGTGENVGEKPRLSRAAATGDYSVVEAVHAGLGTFYLTCFGSPRLMWTENETNNERLFGSPNASPYVKDAFHRALIELREDLLNPEETGTKCAAHYALTVPSGGVETVCLRLGRQAPVKGRGAGEGIKALTSVFTDRLREADEFYDALAPSTMDEDRRRIIRQALAGMLWSKQFYYFDVDRWLEERGSAPFRPRTNYSRNEQWHHMYNADVISMPDKWEYPWYAAWDLAYHVLALSVVDMEFGKEQLELMLNNRYLHPNGQIPAYEWNFGDVNPPVHSWATLFTYQLDKGCKGRGDSEWLKRSFDRLLMNFTWWLNRKDREGRNVFEGGFLGLDNIGVFDRSSPLPTGGWLEQADGTAWMAMFSQNMLQMAIELSRVDRGYEEMALKFAQHFLWISSAMVSVGELGDGMWDEEDGFFYDVLRTPEGHSYRLKVRSIVGLLPLGAHAIFDTDDLSHLSDEIRLRYQRFVEARPELIAQIHDPSVTGVNGRVLFSLVDGKRLRRILKVMLDENEFLSPYGIRSLSRYHEQHPFVMHVGGQEFRVDYLPGESDTGMFGGNSNWRGPIWMPVNALIIRSLLNYYRYFGDEWKVECPTGSGRMMNLFEVTREIAERLTKLFLRDSAGRRPVHGSVGTFQTDEHWRDLLLFYEYFHGDSGAGLGASHQTGWTGVIALIVHLFATLDGKSLLATNREGVFEQLGGNGG